MYRVIVVDDEVWSVIGLTKILKEDSRRFDLVYETTDALDALEKICEKKPDVVFTDVRMPEMNGIELMHAVRERGIDTNFVVISGFAEFSYVQQALQAGALDYHLKPFDRTSVVSMLNRLCEKLENSKPVSDLEFYAFLRDKRENVAELLEGRFGNSLYQKLQVVFFLRAPGTEDLTIETGKETQCMHLKIGPRKSMFIINSNQDCTAGIMKRLYAQEDKIEQAAVSRVTEDISGFEQLVKETEITIRDAFVYPEQKIFFDRPLRRDVITRLEDQISSLYGERKMQQIGRIFSNLPRIFAENNMGVVDAAYFWNRVAMYSAEDRSEPDRVLEYMNVFELTDRFETIEEMSAFLQYDHMGGRDEKTQTVNDKFLEMLQYINKNYAEPLSLKDLCSRFYINISYCCELFQKNENLTFSQYLTHVRITKACEMIRYQHATISEACEGVGYKDYFYFNKVFKKKMGCTPAEYRKAALKEG